MECAMRWEEIRYFSVKLTLPALRRPGLDEIRKFLASRLPLRDVEEEQRPKSWETLRASIEHGNRRYWL